ncbi:hypothetical protein [Burkholderia anthina]|uniref:hypothetical protein n=1 Tax=Burkholderia anthina TaxID=179879 RepID=UPI00158F2240|nr:hypothetical protein [Burkholderia anthina]
MKAHAANVGPAAAHRAFLGYWLLVTRHARTHADAVFDCDLAARSHAYLGAAEAWIANLTDRLDATDARRAPQPRSAQPGAVVRG